MGDFIHNFINGFGDGLYFLIIFVAALGLHMIPKNMTLESKSKWWECLLWGAVGASVVTFFVYANYDCYDYGPGGLYDEMQNIQCSNEHTPERASHAGKIFIISAIMIGTGIYKGWGERRWKSHTTG